MRLLEFLSQAFIGFFGITEPQPAQRRRVTQILGGFILVGLLAAMAVVCFLVFQTHAHH